MSQKCQTCERVFSATSKPQTCGRFKKIFHSSCTKFHSVRSEDESTIIKACSSCIAEANPAAVLSPSNSSSVSSLGENRNSRPATPTLTGSKNATPSLEILEILKAMTSKLDKIDDISNSVRLIDTRVTSIDSRVTSIVERVTSIEASVDGINSRMDTIESRQDATDSKLTALQDNVAEGKEEMIGKVNKLQAEQEAVRQQVIALEDNRSEGISIDMADKERIQALTASNAELCSQVQRLEIKQVQLVHSADIVIGGLPLDGNVNPTLAALAVIKTILPNFETNDIQGARVLSSKKTDHTESESVVAPANDAPIRGADPLLPANQGEVKNRRLAGTLLVTLSSASVAKNVVGAKITWTKLTTAQLKTDLASSAGIKLPDRPTAININEYLSKEIYKLKTLV